MRNQQLSATGQASVVVAVLAFACGVGAVVTIMLAREEQTLRELGKSIPQRIRAEDLGANGPGNNIHVELTQFEAGYDVYTTKFKNSDRWNMVYVPLYPKGQAERGKPFKVAFKSTKISGPAELDAKIEPALLEGLVINATQLQKTNLPELNKVYPNMDMASVWLIDVDRAYPTESAIDRKFTIGSILAGVAVVSLFGALALGISAKRQAPAPVYY